MSETSFPQPTHSRLFSPDETSKSALITLIVGCFFGVIFFSVVNFLPLTGDSETFFLRGERADCFQIPLVCLGDGDIELVNFYGLGSLYLNDVTHHLSSLSGNPTVPSFHLVNSGILLVVVGIFGVLAIRRTKHSRLHLALVLLCLPALLLVSVYQGQLEIIPITLALLAVRQWNKNRWSGPLLIGLGLAFKPILVLLPLTLGIWDFRNTSSVSGKRDAILRLSISYSVFALTWLPTLMISATNDRFSETLLRLYRELFSYIEPSPNSLLFAVIDSVGLIRWHAIITSILIVGLMQLFTRCDSETVFGIFLIGLVALTLRVHPQYVLLFVSGVLLQDSLAFRSRVLRQLFFVLTVIFIGLATLLLLNQYSHPWASAGLNWARRYRDLVAVAPADRFISFSAIQGLGLIWTLCIGLTTAVSSRSDASSLST